MRIHIYPIFNLMKGCLLLLTAIVAMACGPRKGQPRQQEIVQNTRELKEVVPEQIAERLEYVAGNEGMMEDSLMVFRLSALQFAYQDHPHPYWSKEGALLPAAGDMLGLIRTADEYGLVPAHYHLKALQSAVVQLETGGRAAHDAALLAKADVLLTDAFLRMAHQLHFGVTPRDSVTLRTDSLYSDTTLITFLMQAVPENKVSDVLHALEPAHGAYSALKEGYKTFKQQYGAMDWDTLPQQYTDTAAFLHQLAIRLSQSGHLDTGYASPEALTAAVKAFQQEFNIYPDGKAGKQTIRMLNRRPSDWSLQTAINMDRWRKFADTLPERYLLVNIPAFRLIVMEQGDTMLQSRVIVGNPRTRTPVLSSSMTNFVLYPYWRVPYSIVFKEMLPQIKKDVYYLAEKNLEVVDRHGQVVDPATIDWNKLNRHHFPYVLRQMDGLDNSLGIMKFNFPNKFSVYLHDTNNRNLFSNTNRALSHGCVRVQEWDSLAMYLIRDDPRISLRDSVRSWISQEQQKVCMLEKRIPIYIRYFTAEQRNGRLQFYEDIYGEDQVLAAWFKP